MIHAEVAVYPQKTADASGTINSSIDALKRGGVDCRVSSMNTHLHGTEDEVFSALRTAFDAAQSKGVELSMVATITNSADD